MKEQEFCSVEDFVFNSSFREWLLENDSAHKAYWENWIKKNPEKLQLLNYAKGIVYALTVKHKQLSEADVDDEIQFILSKISHAPVGGQVAPAAQVGRKKIFTFQRLLIAAGFIGVIFFAVYFLNKQVPNEKTRAGIYQMPATNAASMVEQVNNSDTIQLVSLQDGSIVQLFAKSKLIFSKNTFEEKREVHLEGEAFFEVKKNNPVPFVVYTKDLVAKVLGTSFNIKAYPFENNTSVLVRTGMVSVYRMEDFSGKTDISSKSDGLMVIPNQQVIYDVERGLLRKAIVDEPVMLNNEMRKTFVFNATPLKDVIKTMQNIYGIMIIYDESVMHSCSLSATMGAENFFEKLDLICKAINASYESIDGNIIISSRGCNQ